MFGLGGSMRRGAPTRDDVAYTSHTAYRAGRGLHWVTQRGGGSVLTPCRALTGQRCRVCQGEGDAETVMACWRCYDKTEPCKRCVRAYAQAAAQVAHRSRLLEVRAGALTDWLNDPRRALPADDDERWAHPVPPSDAMWRYDVMHGEHVYDGSRVSARRVRGEPCPPQRACPQCQWGVMLLRLPLL